MTAPVIVWHRRDLRLHDHQALQVALDRSAVVIPTFILDPGILAREDTAAARVQFMLDSLKELAERYRQLGGQLVVCQGDPLVQLQDLIERTGARTVIWNQDVEPYALRRDQQVSEGLQQRGIEVIRCQDMLLHGPGQILTQAGEYYSVYTPFWRNWIGQPKAQPLPQPGRIQTPEVESFPLPSLQDLGFAWDQMLPEAGETAALDLLELFVDREIFDYEENRNLPSVRGTSQLSPHLRWGTIGIRQVWQATVEARDRSRSEEAQLSVKAWQQEIAWREFYKHVLYAFPRVETGPYRSKYGDLEWDNDLDLFQAWCEGQTGYPMVDAAMRQLNQTGWMHNRCRMIVASFLTKDLLIDWRWGERYFMQKLVDGDLAANNGGWQWSASVGTDPKPMRIFNPATQGAKFDPEGDYIREYVPEISGLDTPALLQVSDSKAGQWAQQERQGCGYPDPIVDHKQRQQEFKRRYQACQ